MRDICLLCKSQRKMGKICYYLTTYNFFSIAPRHTPKIVSADTFECPTESAWRQFKNMNLDSILVNRIIILFLLFFFFNCLKIEQVD